MPSRLESTKMIDANSVQVIQSRCHAVNPPAIARLLMRLPIVKGITPKLALGAEIIRRHASHESRIQLVVNQEQLRVGPHVRRIRRYKNGQVAQDPHPS